MSTDSLTARALAVLLPPGQVVELRAIDAEVGRNFTATVSGYYDDPAKLVEDASGITAPGIYFTFNRVDDRLLARRHNRLKQLKRDKDPTTADKDITARLWLFVEVDPIRPAGICATDAEKAEAAVVIDAVAVHLRGKGWPDPVVIDSGNGFYLLYKIDLSADDGGTVANCLKALARQFDTAAAHIDSSVFNPARIIRLPGTMNRKGDGTADRPHRPCVAVSVPDKMVAVPVDLIEDLAATAPADEKKAGAARGGNNGTGDYAHRLVAPVYLAHYGVSVLSTKHDADMSRWRIVCPFNPDHTGTDAYFFQRPVGAYGFHCSHNSCRGNQWEAFKERVGKPLPDHYDPPMVQARANFSGQHASSASASDRSGSQQRDEKQVGAPGNRFVASYRLASAVKPRPVQWIWPQRIPVGRMSVLAGRGGLGKSVVTADLVATITAPKCWPGRSGSLAPRGSVVMMCAEDDAEDTTVPRLIAHGANMDKVVLLDGKRPADDGKGFVLGITCQDVDIICEAVEAAGDCKLILVDPIGSYLGGQTDSHRDNEVRAVLDPLIKLSRDKGAGLLVVAHVRKSENQYADDAVLGSRAFTTLSRSVLHLAADPDNKDRYLLAPGKMNIGRRAPTLAYKVDQVNVPGAGFQPLLVWEEDEIEGMTADDILGGGAGRGRPGPEPTQIERAVAWLEGVLDGEKNGVESAVVDRGAKAASITDATLRRAKEQLCVTAKRQKGSPSRSKDRKWYCGIGDDWEPPALPEEPQPESKQTGGSNGENGDTPQDTENVSTYGSQSTQPLIQQQLPVDAQTTVQPEHLRDAEGNVSTYGDQPAKQANRKRSAKAKIATSPDPLTDTDTLHAAVQSAGWTPAQAVGWLEAQDEFVPGSDLAGTHGGQRRKLLEHLATITGRESQA